MQSTLLARRFAAATALGIAALGGATSAHARGDVTFSIGIQVPGAYVYAAPVYVPPAPVYIQPQPVYVQPQPIYLRPAPVFVQPRPVFVQPPPYGHFYQSGPGWQPAQWERHHKRGHRGRKDKHHNRWD